MEESDEIDDMVDDDEYVFEAASAFQPGKSFLLISKRSRLLMGLKLDPGLGPKFASWVRVQNFWIFRPMGNG